MMRSRTSRVAAALSMLALLLVACQITITVPEPDLQVTAERVTNDPGVLDTISIPGGATRVVEVQYRAITTSPALMFFEVQGSGVDGTVRVEFRSESYRFLVASQSSRRFATQVGRLGAEVGDDLAGRADTSVERSIALTWECFGPCVARPYEAGTYLVKLENTGSTSRSVSILAYGLEPTDPNEPNDAPATATLVEVASAGDGDSGAIEHVTDIDYFRFTCSGEFEDGMRLTLVSDFDRAIVLRADGRDYPPGSETDPIACGSTVSVSTSDGTAGPSLYSNYSIVADPAALYELDVVAQGLVSVAPVSLGTVTVPGNRSRLVRLVFPTAAGADLRYIEIAGANVEPSVRLQVYVGGESVGVSTRRDLFASSLSALSLGAADHVADPAAIGVVWNCGGPCVAERYRSGEVIARITNTSSTARTVDVYAYGTPEGDLNEPNDRPQDATEVVIEAEGDFVVGALERIGDVDYFRFLCGADFADLDLRLTLESTFRGDIVMDVPGQAPVGPGTSRVVDCPALVSVYTRDDTAGPSAASRYRIDVD